MFSVTIKDKGVRDLIKALPKSAGRAAEIALDKTAKDIKQAEIKEMQRVFDRPVRYTLNSLRVTPTRNHNMRASVWFKEPDRMGQHYLVPQVEGGPRKTKGFERALDDKMFIPGKFARMTRAGNVSPGQIRQIMSVLGKAERYAGYQANITARSAKRNKKQRDYVQIFKRHGRLLPGVYQRFSRPGHGIKSGTYQALQRGTGRVAIRDERTGRIVGWKKKKRSFHTAIRARGLRPILLEGHQRKAVKPLLDFYGVANRVYDKEFIRHFNKALDRQLRL